MFGRKLTSLFKTTDVTAPATGFQETRALEPESAFAPTEMAPDSDFGDTQFSPGQTNVYRCVCGAQWDGVWTTRCNDTCPACGKDTAPTHD